MDKRIYFASFADGSQSIKNAGKRIASQASSSGMFHKIIVFDKTSLEKLLPIDQNQSSIMTSKIHGFGYFSWKPTLLKGLLEEKIPENAILVYCDSGTELVVNTFAKKKFLKLVYKLDNQPVVAFHTKFPEFKYTKSLCLSLLDDIEQRQTNQIEATTILLRNCAEARMFISKWYEFALKENFMYIDNNLDNEIEGFIEHRWDQSIFSVLYKNAGYKSLQMRQVFGYLHENTNLTLFRRFRFNSFFLWQIRNRTGESILKRYQSNTLVSFIFLPLQYLITPIEYLNEFKKRIFYKFKVIISRIIKVQQ